MRSAVSANRTRPPTVGPQRSAYWRRSRSCARMSRSHRICSTGIVKLTRPGGWHVGGCGGNFWAPADRWMTGARVHSSYRVMDRYELGAIGERALDPYVVEHLRPSL